MAAAGHGKLLAHGATSKLTALLEHGLQADEQPEYLKPALTCLKNVTNLGLCIAHAFLWVHVCGRHACACCLDGFDCADAGAQSFIDSDALRITLAFASSCIPAIDVEAAQVLLNVSCYGSECRAVPSRLGWYSSRVCCHPGVVVSRVPSFDPPRAFAVPVCWRWQVLRSPCWPVFGPVCWRSLRS